MAIHEHIRQDGEKELERDAMALLWSAIAAGLSMGASLLAKGYFMSNWKECQAASYWRISVIPLVLLSSLWPASNCYRKHRDCGTTRHAKTDNEQRRLTYAIMGRRAAG